jgi:hypothetical protein
MQSVPGQNSALTGVAVEGGQSRYGDDVPIRQAETAGRNRKLSEGTIDL